MGTAGNRYSTARVMLLALLVTSGSVPAAPPIEAYGRLPGVERMSLSPGGENFATIAVAGEQRNLIVGTVSGKVLLAAGVGDAKIRRIHWVGDDHLLLSLTSTFSFTCSSVRISRSLQSSTFGFRTRRSPRSSGEPPVLPRPCLGTSDPPGKTGASTATLAASPTH